MATGRSGMLEPMCADAPIAGTRAGDDTAGGAAEDAAQDPREDLRDDLPGVARLLSLSDGVVAIALTLLVLQLTVPLLRPHVADSASVLATRLSAQTAELFSYLIAFYVIAQFWLAHHRVFRHISGHDEGLAWWNFAFLLTITLMPFTSNLLGDYDGNPLAVDIFAANLLLASLASQAVVVYGRRRRLLDPSADPAMAVGRQRSLAVIGAVVLSMGVAWVDTDAAKYCWLLIAVGPWATTRWQARRAARAAAA